MSYEHDPDLSRWIDSVRAVPALSREDEHDLAVRARAGDMEAMKRLVSANARYVVAVALQYRRYGVPLGDLIAEGNLGLVIAVRKFDADRGTRFVTYAGYWIRAYVLDLVVRSSTMVGAGSGPHRSKLFFRLRRERARVANLTLDPTEQIQRLAESFEVTPERMEHLLRRLDARDVALDAPAYDEADVTMRDLLVSPLPAQDEQLEAQRSSQHLSGRLETALAGLDRRERYIVEKRLMQDEEVSLAALGRKLGVSRERVRQLEARAKKKLRGVLEDLAPTVIPDAA